MQAGKIEIKAVYAIRHVIDEVDTLVPFRVVSVTTVKESDHPSGHKSTISGIVLGDDLATHREVIIALNPKRLLGPYTEHLELVERKRIAIEEVKRIASEKEKTQMELATILYRLAGMEMPEDVTHYNRPIQVRSGYEISIEYKAVIPLLASLKKLETPQ